MILFYKSIHIVAVVFLWGNVAYSLARVRASLNRPAAGQRPSRSRREEAAAGERAPETPGDIFSELARSDLWFTGSAWAVITVTGWLLMGVVNTGWLDTGWLTLSILLTAAGVVIWLAVVMPLQRRLAKRLAVAGQGVPPGDAGQLISRWYGAVILSLGIIPAVVLYLIPPSPAR